MKYLSLILLSILMIGCDSRKNCCTIKDTFIGISVQNARGADLLNPKTSGAFLKDEIKLFYVEHGKPVEVYYPTADLPRNFDIRKKGSTYQILVFVNEAAGKSDTYIR